MTQNERDIAIQAIKSSNTPLPVKAKQVTAVIEEFNALDNPDPIFFNESGEGLTRRVWESMTFAERNAFRDGGKSEQAARYIAYDATPANFQ